jgi:23S rRNA G2445 N2-methylase RlmL
MLRTKTSPLNYRTHEKITVLDEYRKEWKDAPEDINQPVWCVDAQLGNLRSCKKNAKLAGVEKAITFSKYDPEWMDVKFDEAEVGCIVTVPPPVTARRPDDTHIKELCYQAEYVLAENGRLIIGCLTKDTVEAVAKHANAYKLTLTQEAVVYSGQLPVHVMCYEL